MRIDKMEYIKGHNNRHIAIISLLILSIIVPSYDVYASTIDSSIAWSNWATLGGATIYSPGGGRNYVLIRGTDNAFWRKEFGGSD